MKSKIILLSFCTVVLGQGAGYGLNCPSIPKNWDGKTLEASGPIAWSVGKLKLNEDVELKDVASWQAYHAWILPKNKKQYEKNGYFQCNYVGYKGEIKKENKVGKLTITSPQTPELLTLAQSYEFRGGKDGTVDNKYNKSGKEGSKCTPTLNDPESINKFPPTCEIIEKKK